MSRRIVLGKRSNGDCGLFISPPGVDAFTVADASLVLNVSEKVSQLILLGFVASSQTVALGLARSPFIHITSENTMAMIPGHVGSGGPTRPSPLPGYAGSTAVVNSNGASVTITCVYKTRYAVYGSAYT